MNVLRSVKFLLFYSNLKKQNFGLCHPYGKATTGVPEPPKSYRKICKPQKARLNTFHLILKMTVVISCHSPLIDWHVSFTMVSLKYFSETFINFSLKISIFL